MFHRIIKSMAMFILTFAMFMLPCSLYSQQTPSQKASAYPKIKKEMAEWILKNDSSLRDFSSLIKEEPKIFVLIAHNQKDREKNGFWQVVNDVNIGKKENKEENTKTLQGALSSYGFSSNAFARIEGYFKSLGLDGIVSGVTLGHKAIVFIRQTVTETGEGFCPMYVFDLKNFNPSDYPGVEKLDGNWYLAPPEALAFD